MPNLLVHVKMLQGTTATHPKMRTNGSGAVRAWGQNARAVGFIIAFFGFGKLHRYRLGGQGVAYEDFFADLSPCVSS